jgi:hypothetical protein
MSALVAPLETIRSNLAQFALKKQEVLRTRSKYQVLLESNTKNLLKNTIEPSLERFKDDEKARVQAFIADWSHEFRALSSRRLQEALEENITGEIRAAYDEWLAHEEPAISQAFDLICGLFWSDIQKTIDDLLSYSAALSIFDSMLPCHRFCGGKNPLFATNSGNEPVGLQTLTSSIVLGLPKMLGERLIVWTMHKRADHLIEMHAGRIRHDFDKRLKRNVSAFCSQLLARIEATIAGIEKIRAYLHGGPKESGLARVRRHHR